MHSQLAVVESATLWLVGQKRPAAGPRCGTPEVWTRVRQNQGRSANGLWSWQPAAPVRWSKSRGSVFGLNSKGSRGRRSQGTVGLFRGSRRALKGTSLLLVPVEPSRAWRPDGNCKTVCIGKITRRGHPAFAGNRDNQSRAC